MTIMPVGTLNHNIIHLIISEHFLNHHRYCITIIELGSLSFDYSFLLTPSYNLNTAPITSTLFSPKCEFSFSDSFSGSRNKPIKDEQIATFFSVRLFCDSFRLSAGYPNIYTENRSWIQWPMPSLCMHIFSLFCRNNFSKAIFFPFSFFLL